VVHHPSAINSGIPPYAVAIAERVRTGRVTIYAGAGLSFAEPAGLPTGAAVAEQIHARLKDAFPALNGVDRRDLVAIADAVAGLNGGEDALRLVAVQAAEFTTATPTYGHRVLALLLLEGVVDVLTTNWDNCVERAGSPETVPSVVTDHDRLHVAGRCVLKIHGCATRPESLLLTTDHLRAPPVWVVDETRARLGNALVVFVGIGDIAAYVSQRLSEAVTVIGSVDNIRVVGPSIVTAWEDSEWSNLLPMLPDDHRIAATADEFLEKLGGAYVNQCLADLAADLHTEPGVAEALVAAADGLRTHDARTVLAWARRAGVVAKTGVPVLSTESIAEVLAALGTLTGHEFTITRDSTIDTPKESFEVLVSVGLTPASRFLREARNRLEQHRANGRPDPTFLVGGGLGWGAPAQSLPVDIVAEGDELDVVDGPMIAEPRLIRASEVLVA
jgi:hypothetical protein